MNIPRDVSDPQAQRVLIASFAGWSDAGNAASTVTQHINDALQLEELHVIGSESYVDYQLHRPQRVIAADGTRHIHWPESRLLGPSDQAEAEPRPEHETVRTLDGAPFSQLFLFEGIEPAHHWQAYADEFLELIDTWDIDLVIIIGALYSDAPHTRPIITSVSAESQELRTRFDAERSDYEGPVGITSVIADVLEEAGIGALTLWAQVPHYVHSVPSPKATLALLDKCEELLNIVIPRGELLTEATQWEQNIDTIAGQDEEMSHYIKRLEEARDSFEGPEATGDAIAYELERFLRIRRDEQGGAANEPDEPRD